MNVDFTDEFAVDGILRSIRKKFGPQQKLAYSNIINHHLVMAARELEGREALPSAGVIDSQSANTTKGVRHLGL